MGLILDSKNHSDSEDNGKRKKYLEQHEVGLVPVITGRQFNVRRG